MGLNLADMGSILADEVKRGLKNSKAETVKEFKAMVPALIAEALGTGAPGFKSLAAALEKDVLSRIPQGSVFDRDHGKGYDSEIGLKSLGKKAADEMADQILFTLLRPDARAEHPRFRGKTGQKALSSSTGSAGGYTLPEEFIAEVQRKLVHTSVFLGQCRKWTGVDLIGKMPRETGTVSVTIAGELVTPANTQFSLGAVTWALQKRMALTNLPQELWKFSGIDVLNLLATMFAEQFQKTEDNLYMNGSGSQQPMGVLTNQSGMTTLSIAGSTLQWQDLNKTKHSVKSQYRLEKPNCAWMMNNNSIEIIGSLADDQNRPIFMDRGPEGMAGADVPPQTVGWIEGYPVLENPYVPGPVTEATSTPSSSYVLFGNWLRGYASFKGAEIEVKTSDQAYDAFINDGLYTRAIDMLDGKPIIGEALAILSGVK